MQYFIFNEDNTFSWTGTAAPESIMVDTSSGQFLVELPDTCWTDIPDDERSNILYDSENTQIVLDVDRFVLPSARAQADLEEQLRSYMLIPVEERDGWYDTLINLCSHFLPESLVTAITDDSVLTDAEAQQILDYLDD